MDGSGCGLWVVAVAVALAVGCSCGCGCGCGCGLMWNLMEGSLQMLSPLLDALFALLGRHYLHYLHYWAGTIYTNCTVGPAQFALFALVAVIV